MISKLVLSVAFLITAMGYAVAQTSPQLFAQSTRPITCGDFQRDPTGWWGPVIQVTVNGRSTSLAAIASQQCSNASPATPLRMP